MDFRKNLQFESYGVKKPKLELTACRFRALSGPAKRRNCLRTSDRSNVASSCRCNRRKTSEITIAKATACSVLRATRLAYAHAPNYN